MDVVCGRHIAGERGHDGADLLIARQEKECRRAPVALDADSVETRFEMGELAVTMRWDRAAGMFVGIDE